MFLFVWQFTSIILGCLILECRLWRGCWMPWRFWPSLCRKERWLFTAMLDWAGQASCNLCVITLRWYSIRVMSLISTLLYRCSYRMLSGLHLSNQCLWSCPLCSDQKASLNPNSITDQSSVWFRPAGGLSAGPIPVSEHAARFLLQSPALPPASGPSAARGRGPDPQTHAQDPARPLQHADHSHPGGSQSSRGPERTGEEAEHLDPEEGREGDTSEEKPVCSEGLM